MSGQALRVIKMPGETKIGSYNTIDDPSSDISTSWSLSAYVKSLFSILGPGMMVCLADSNAGDLLTAAQCGARFGYMYLPWMAVYVLPLYGAIELTTRISLSSSPSLFAMISQDLALPCSYFMLAVVLFTAIGGLVMQVRVLVAIGLMVGICDWVTCVVITVVLVSISLLDSYAKMEVVGLSLGAFELAFVVAGILSRPDPSAMIAEFKLLPSTLDATHVNVTAALTGAVMMPWMFFYQAAAVKRKGLDIKDLAHEQTDLLMGSVLTQVIMAGLAVATAVATIGTDLDLEKISFDEIPTLLEHAMPFGKLFFIMGILGSAFIASLVIALAISWAVEDAVDEGLIWAVSHRRRTPDGEAEALPITSVSATQGRHQIMQIAFATSVVFCCIVALTGVNVIGIIMFCDILNSLTLLPTLLVVLLLANTRIENSHQIAGTRKVVTWICFIVVGLAAFQSGMEYLFSEEFAQMILGQQVQSSENSKDYHDIPMFQPRFFGWPEMTQEVPYSEIYWKVVKYATSLGAVTASLHCLEAAGMGYMLLMAVK